MSNARMASLDFGVYDRTFADIDRKIEFLPGDVVLDLGGGTGQISGLIAGKAGRVVLADGAGEALRAAREILADLPNLSFVHLNIEQSPLVFANSAFDKIICYSVVHYLKDQSSFAALISEMLRIVKSEGKIFIGDIPLSDKGKRYLDERKKHFFQNLLGNLKYYFRKFLTAFFYRLKGIRDTQVSGVVYSKDGMEEVLSRIGGINYRFLEQDASLPFANSREDLLIIKKQ